jgi:hypothetical protein
MIKSYRKGNKEEKEKYWTKWLVGFGPMARVGWV